MRIDKVGCIDYVLSLNGVYIQFNNVVYQSDSVILGVGCSDLSEGFHAVVTVTGDAAGQFIDQYNQLLRGEKS